MACYSKLLNSFVSKVYVWTQSAKLYCYMTRLKGRTLFHNWKRRIFLACKLTAMTSVGLRGACYYNANSSALAPFLPVLVVKSTAWSKGIDDVD